MATPVAVSPVQVAAAPVQGNIPLTEKELEHNNQVDGLLNDLHRIASDVASDMKARQLPDGVKHDKVYGPRAANRSQLNSLASLIKHATKVVGKLKKSEAKKPSDRFVGFSVPSYIRTDMAMAIGLREGSSPLWPAGGKPIFAAALITRFFSHYVMVNGLTHADNLSVFSANEMMVRLYSPFVVSSAKPGQPPIDLQNLTYPTIQQLNKNFVEKRSKTSPGPNLNPETADGAQLVGIFKQLEERFKQLGAVKETVTSAMLEEAKAKEDVVKAKKCLDAGQITVELFNRCVQSYKELSEARVKLEAGYKTHAKTMGIA